MKKLDSIAERWNERPSLSVNAPIIFHEVDYLIRVAELARVAMSTGQTVAERASAHQMLYDLLEEEA